MNWRAKEPRNRFFVAQLAAYLDRLDRGDPVLAKRELEYALSNERLAELASEVADARDRAAEARKTEVPITGHAAVYWRAAQAAFSAKAALRPRPRKTGTKAAGNWAKRAYEVKILAEHASEEWPEVESNQHRFFNMPPDEGWDASFSHRLDTEWALPILKKEIEMGGPELREIPRYEQIEAISSVLMAHAELEVRPVSNEEYEAARARLAGVRAKT